MEAPLRPAADILRRNPQHDYELVQRVGSGTYGDVYKPPYQEKLPEDYSTGSITSLVPVPVPGTHVIPVLPSEVWKPDDPTEHFLDTENLTEY